MLASLFSAAKKPRRLDHLLIACMPKSGSTYMNTVLRELTGLPDAYIGEWGLGNEADIRERTLRRLRRRSVIQQHVRATEPNVQWILEYGIRPILQVRSLFDAVVSLHDHFDRERTGLPTGFICGDFWHWSWNDRIEFLIQVHLPWYFNFLVSWRDAADRVEFCPVNYEGLFADRIGTLTRVLRFYGFQIPRERIEAVVGHSDGRKTRLNVGVSGRGEKMLTARHKQAIRNLAAACRIELSETGCAMLNILPSEAPEQSVERSTISFRSAA